MNAPANNATLQAALRAHQANRLQEAELLYRQVVRREPANLDALYLLGVLLHQSSRSADAVDPLQRAVAKAPERPEFLNALGDALRVTGRYADARGFFERAIAARADFAEAQQNLALTLNAEGRKNEALVLLFTAVAARPTHAGLRHLLVAMLQGVGLQAGNDIVRQVLRLLLTDPQVHAQSIAGAVLGIVKADLGIGTLSMHGDQTIATTAWLTGMSSHELLRSALPRIIVSDSDLELALTNVRAALMRACHDGTASDEMKRFAEALAAQCFNTEYAWMVSADELDVLNAVKRSVATALGAESLDIVSLESWLVMLAMYEPLHAIEGVERILDIPLDQWSDGMRALLQEQLVEHAEEQRIAQTLAVRSPIRDPVSRAVREMYEDHPYPRWVMVPQPQAVPLGAYIGALRPDVKTQTFGASRILVAGCGSGQQAVQLALTHRDAPMLAIDLSRASLAYGARLAGRFGVSHIEFAQADLLEFDPVGERFAMIACTGVLHHLRDPLEGWRRLTSWLVPGGVMKIGLYSTLARASVDAARAHLGHSDGAVDAATLRTARRELLSLPHGHPARGVLTFSDFFSLSGFRDLVMHVQERSYTIGELIDALALLKLRFLGFQLPQPIQARFHAEQGPHAVLDLHAWDRFERAYPDTFAAMYQFWCCPT